MKTVRVAFILGLVLLVASVASAVDFTGWKQIEVNEADFNSSSDTAFTVMLPPGYTESTVDSSIGPITSFADETDPNALITIIVINNPVTQKLNDKNSKMYLDNFMLGANITPKPDSEPLYLENGGIVDYGTSGDDFAGVYILSTDEKVMIVSGFYKTAEDAVSGVENLAVIAGTIEITAPAAA